jgi:hypothetical protein
MAVAIRGGDVRAMAGTVLVVAALVGAVACGDNSGDGDEVGALSESEFRDQANEICRRASADDPVDISELIRRLDALVPPESMQDEVSEMLTQFRDYQQDASSSPPTDTVREADRLADDLGLSDCTGVLEA